MDFREMTYEEAVSYIDSVPRFTKKNSLEHTRAFLHRLGDPQEGMKIFHVAGTNGKGSVCAFISSILSAAGYRVGLFTSPHLVRINERFIIDGAEVSDAEFLRAFLTVMDCVEELLDKDYTHPTYFEMLFLIGMVIFREREVEYLALETGLGGRLDATNSVEHPILTVITSISLDHTEYLGDTVTAIAGEKAGIIKPGVPVVYDASDEEAAAVIRRKAHLMNAPAYPVIPEKCEISRATDKYVDFSLNSGYHDNICLSVKSAALYQVKNAAVAVTAVRLSGALSGFSDEVIQRGVSLMRWPGRMETVLPGVIVDGAHNEAGVAEFVNTAKRLGAGREITLLFASVSDKDYPGMIGTICRELDLKRVVVTEVGGYRCVDADEAAAYFRRYGRCRVTSVADVGEAFSEALAEKGDGILFCVGSLYLAGKIEAVLEKRKTQDD